eukprot:gene56179-75013_t
MEAKYLFKQHLITLANRVKYNYIVILIDEAQLVLLNEWHWLLGLQNELDLEGSLNELEYILDGYDEDSEWPDHSG